MKLHIFQNVNVLPKTHYLYVGYSHRLILCQFCTYFTSFSFLVNHTESVTCILYIRLQSPLSTRNENCQTRESVPIHIGWSEMMDYMDNQCNIYIYFSIEILNVAIY